MRSTRSSRQRADPRTRSRSTATLPIVPGQWLTLPEVAERLDLTEIEVYVLARVAVLPVLRMGGRRTWRVERGQLEEWIERRYRDTDMSSGVRLRGDRSPRETALSAFGRRWSTRAQQKGDSKL